MLALVIDDSQTMRRILRRIVAPLGFDVYEAGHGQEALELLAEAPTVPDVALVALMMVTTESEQGSIVRALAAGAHEYVIKPFPAEAIREKLALLGLVPAAG